MKEETKDRLKKLGKVTAYGLGLFAMFLLGYGLRGCPVYGESAKAQSVPHSVLADQKALNPKRALDASLLDNLVDSPDNLLLDSEGGAFRLSDYSEGDQHLGYRVVSSSYYNLYLLPLDVGKYVFEYVEGTYSWTAWGFFINANGANDVRQAFNGEPVERCLIEDADIKPNSKMWLTDYSFNSVLSVDSSFPYLVLFVNNQGPTKVKVGTYDPIKFPSLASIDLGQYYNPLPMIGQTINDASIIVYPSAGSSVNVAPVDFVNTSANNFLFVSAGSVFDGFRIELSRVMNLEGSQIERYAMKSGETQIAPAMSSNYVTANAFYYRLASSQQWVKVWELPYNGTDQGFNYWSYNGRWLSSSFRYIEIKVDEGGTGLSSWLPTFTLTDLLALNVWTAGAFVLGDSYTNVFTMLGKGFESVGGILSIQILPYMTLGTLIFVPLVVLIIFAILRILNK